jgi:hypothetical protein
MKTLDASLLAEQKKAFITPAVKIGIQSYGFPAKSDRVSQSYFDWKPRIDIPLGFPIMAASPSDGSLIVLDADLKTGTVTGTGATFSGTPTGGLWMKYTVKISSTGTPDKLKWQRTDDGGPGGVGAVYLDDPTAWSAEISCSTSPTLLTDGVYVTYASATGHSVGDTCYQSTEHDPGNFHIRRFTNSATDTFTPVAGTPIAITNKYYTTGPTANFSLAIAANKNHTNVIIVGWDTAAPTHLQYKESTDCGATWSGWTAIGTFATGTYNYTWDHLVSLGMNDAGDVGLQFNYYDPAVNGCCNMTRPFGGTWSAPNNLAATITNPQIFYDSVIGWYVWKTTSLVGFDGTIYDVTVTKSTTMTNEYGNMIQLTMNGRNANASQPNTSSLGSFAVADRSNINQDVANALKSLETSTWKINSDFYSTQVYQVINQIKGTAAIGTPNINLPYAVQTNSNNFIFNNRVYVYKVVKNGLYDLVWANHIPVPYPALSLRANQFAVTASTADYVFFLYGGAMYVSTVLDEWSPPTIGTGAGSEYNILTSNIVGIQARCVRNQAGGLILTFPNNSGEFNSPGSGSLSGLARGSRIDLYPGYLIGSTETTSEIQRFFVDNWNYSRKANYAMFTLVCDDAWGLLDKYKIPVPTSFNYQNAAVTYTIYELIEMMVKCIGGTLTYESRSTDILATSYKLEINMGDTAGTILRRLLALVPDVIKWFGNDATVIYPLSTDSSVYDYAFPQNDVYL